MPDSIDDLIPYATKIRQEAAVREAEKAEEYVRIAADVAARAGAAPADRAV